MKKGHLENIIGLAGSILVFLLSVQRLVPVEISPLEAIAAVSSAWSVWLLAKNNLLGWWVGLVGVIAYAVVFLQVKLYGDVAIQLFYLVTSLQAIYIWLRGGENKTEKPVGHISWRWLIISAVLAAIGILGLRSTLILLGGAAPFWDSIATVLSVVAQLFLMERYVESWYLWIAVDTIYVPLYLSRKLYLTSLLYGIFWVMATYGLQNFKQIYRSLRQEKSL